MSDEFSYDGIHQAAPTNDSISTMLRLHKELRLAKFFCRKARSKQAGIETGDAADFR